MKILIHFLCLALSACAPRSEEAIDTPNEISSNSELSPLVETVQGRTLGELNPDADYYAIYYSAHWCGPCRAFTPQLSAFYKSNFEEGGKFDVLFVSSDRSEEDMQKYIEWGDMQFPALNYGIKKSMDEIMKYKARSIPQLVLIDRKGTIISDSHPEGEFLGPEHVLDELKLLLK